MAESNSVDVDEVKKVSKPKTFDDFVRLLVQTSFDIHDKLYGAMNSGQLWMTWINNFYTTYIKADKPAAFHKMFKKFYLKNIKKIAVPIFEEDGEDTKVNDEWLKDRSYLDGPGVKAKLSSANKKKGWDPTDNRCRGNVIYFDNDNPKWIKISVPISEIYSCATKLYHNKGDDDPGCASYPGKILMCLYGIFDNLIEDDAEEKKLINDNLNSLENFINQISSDEDVSKSGTGLSSIGKIMSQVMKAAGIEGKIDGEGIAKALGGALNEGTINGIGKVVGEVTKAVNGESGEGPKGIEDVLGGLGKAFQSQGFKDAIAETSSSVNLATSSLQSSIPKRNDGIKKVSVFNPQDQE